MRINSTWWLRLYAWLRGLTSPWIYKHFYRPDEGSLVLGEMDWDIYKNIGVIESFSNIINLQQYRPDRLGGLLDCSFPVDEPAYFFCPLRHGRDCDEWARIWRIWGEYHGYHAEEYIVTRLKIRGGIKWYAHFITLLEKDGVWTICDYTPRAKTTSRLSALTTHSKMSGGKHYQEYTERG